MNYDKYWIIVAVLVIIIAISEIRAWGAEDTRVFCPDPQTIILRHYEQQVLKVHGFAYDPEYLAPAPKPLTPEACNEAE